MPTQMTALIVDDEAPIRQFVQRVLHRAGVITLTATDGHEAARVFASNRQVDVLVTDMQMPDMNGEALAGELRKQEPALNVIYLTGLTEGTLPLGPHDRFLVKPCTIAALLAAVSEVTGRRITSSLH